MDGSVARNVIVPIEDMRHDGREYATPAHLPSREMNTHGLTGTLEAAIVCNLSWNTDTLTETGSATGGTLKCELWWNTFHSTTHPVPTTVKVLL